MQTKELTMAFCDNESCKYHWIPRKANPQRCPRCQQTNIRTQQLEVNV